MKKLIKLTVTATVKLLDGKLGIDIKTIETDRLYMVGVNMTKVGYKRNMLEALEIEMAKKHPTVSKYQILKSSYKISNGVPKTRRRTVPLWVKDCRTGEAVKYNCVADAAVVIGMKHSTLSSAVSNATKTIRYSKFSKYYEISLNGVDFTSSENPTLLNDSFGVLRIHLTSGKKKSLTVVTLINKKVRVYPSVLAAAKALKMSNSTITRLASNVAINRHNSYGDLAFWYTDEYIPGESVVKMQRKRDYMSIRVEAISVTNGEKVVYKTINTILDKMHINYDTFIRNYLNRTTPLDGFLFRTLGSSCEIPTLVA